MACNSCGKSKCCCTKVITERGLRGPAGKDGKIGPPGVQAPLGPLPVANTVYVSKSGSDSTGLAERFDRPFLTLAAARAAAVALVPDATKRILIVVEKGRYLEPIDLADFVDWDLGSSIIDGGEIGRATIDDFTTVGGVNSIIYGFADIRKTAFSSGASKSCVLIRRAASNVTIYCNKIGSSVGGALEMTNGTLYVKCKELYSTAESPDAFGTGMTGASNMTVDADYIYANGTCIGNASSGTLNVIAREIRTLVEANNFTTVDGDYINIRNAKIINENTPPPVVYVSGSNCVLKDCVVVSLGTGYSVSSVSAQNIKIYGSCFANTVTSNITAIVGAVTVDTDVS